MTKPGWPRFQLRTLLLGTFVVATLCDVFLRPEVPQELLGGVLVIESREVEQKPASTPPQYLPHGPWRLHTLTGHTLAEGYHDQGQPQGRWRYYDSRGNLQADVVCESPDELTLTGTWHYYGATGEIEREVTLPTESMAPAPASQTMTASSTSIDQWRTMAESKTFLERVQAVRELRRLGAAAVPALVSIVEQSNHPARERALWRLQQMGAQANSATKPLASLATHDNDPLQPALLQTLLAIDPASRVATVRQLMELCAVQKTISAWDLYRSLDSRLGLATRPSLTDDLKPFVDDERPAVRQLTAGLLLFQLAVDTYSDPFETGWYRDYFQLGLTNEKIFTTQQHYSSQQYFSPVEENDALIDQLTRLEKDKDARIRTAVEPVLHDDRAGKLWQNVGEGSIPPSGCFVEIL